MKPKSTIKKTSTKTIVVRDIYHLTDEIKYVVDFKNGKETGRHLQYKGKSHFGYELNPIYKKDLSLLKTTNPYWGKYDWFETDKLPSPENIDLKNIIFVQGSTHMFFDIKKNPIPVVHKGDYIGANFDNGHYDLDKLRKHLLKHKRVVSVSEILDIPYYNSENGKDKYIDVLVLPDSKTIQKGLENKWTRDETCFGKYYDKNGFDYLGIKKFLLPEKEMSY
jgi:hypothetical protein